MMDQYCFAIRVHHHHFPNDAKCPICGDKTSVGNLNIYDNNNEPLCSLCAWEQASNLAHLLSLYEAVSAFEVGQLPDHVCAALKQRRNDPERLKTELRDALDTLDNHGHGAPPAETSPLVKLVSEQITAALETDDVETMRQARCLFKEGLGRVFDDNIPF